MGESKSYDREVIHKIENKWGDELTHIVTRDASGSEYIFDALHDGEECSVVVNENKWVFVKVNKSKYWDVFGTI